MKTRGIRCEVRGANVMALMAMIGAFTIRAMAQDDAPKLQPPLGEIPPTFWEQHGLTVILSAGGCVLFVVLGIWFWLQPKAVAVLSAEEKARKELEALSKRAEDGDVISRASQVLRQYVLTTFELPAGQPTTAEFCQLIAQNDRIGNELSSSLAAFLRECDERKFAKSGLVAPLNAVARVREFIKQGEARQEQLRLNATEQGGKSVARAA